MMTGLALSLVIMWYICVIQYVCNLWRDWRRRWMYRRTDYSHIRDPRTFY
jgi:hypothetical protein